MTKLKACPFCGRTPYEFVSIDGEKLVECRGDCLIWGKATTPEAWNTRAPDPRLQKAIEEITEIWDKIGGNGGYFSWVEDGIGTIEKHIPEVKDE